MKDSGRLSKHSSTSQDGGAANGPASLEVPGLAKGELGQLQEIIFGSQLRASTDQLESMRTQFNSQLTAMAQNMAQNYEQQISTLNTRIEGLQKNYEHRLRQQQEQHQVELKAISSKFAESDQLVKGKIATISEQLAVGQTKIEAELRGSNQHLAESITDLRRDLLAEIETKSAELQSQKLDRNALSQLLGKVSNELSAHPDKEIISSSSSGQPEVQTADD